MIDLLEFLYVCETTSIADCFRTKSCKYEDLCEITKHEDFTTIFYSEGE